MVSLGKYRGRAVFSPWLSDSPEDIVFLSFLWIATLGVYTLGTADAATAAQAARCFFSGSSLMLMALAGFLAIAPVRRSRMIPFLVLVSAIVVPPLQLAPFNRAGLAMLDLYLISFVALPVFLRVITVGASLIVSLVSCGLAYYCASQMLDGGDVFAVAIVPVAGAVAIVASAGSPVRPLRPRPPDGYGIFGDRASDQPGLFSRRFWLTATLFLSLLLVLLFFNLAIANLPLADSAPTIYTIVGFLVGCFLLSSVAQRHLKPGAIILLSSAATMIANLTYNGQAGALHPVLPVVAAQLATVLLPWTVGLQVTLTFLSLLGAAGVILSHAAPGALTIQGIGDGLISYRPDIAAILVCGTICVLASRIANRRPLGIVAAGLEGFPVAARRNSLRRGELSGIFHLPLASRYSVSEARSTAMVSNILLLSVLSNLVVTLMILRKTGLPLIVCAGSWLIGLLAWAGLFIFNHRNRDKEPVWFFAGFITIALLSLPSIFLAWHPEGFDLWFLWLLCIFVGIGLSPWRLVELVPISFAVLMVGLVVGEELQNPPHGELVYAITLLLSIFASIQTSRRVKTGSVLSQIEPALSAAGDATRVAATVADHLAELFESPFVMIRTESDGLLVASGGTVMPMPSSRWPLNQLVDRIGPPSGPEFLRGLPAAWDFTDPACGSISVRNAVLFRLPERQAAEGAQPAHAPAILVPVLFLIPALWRRGELAVADALVGFGRLRAESLREAALREQATGLMERTQSERELELGTLVHDINNTVQDLTVLCDMLIEDPDDKDNSAGSVDPKAEGTVRRIAEIARSMAAVVSDAKRKRELEMLSDLRPRETVSVKEVLTEILSFARIRGERKRIDVSGPEKFDESVFVRVSAREHLETILRNLLNNAMSYSDPGTQIRVSVDFDAERVRIHVIDNGRGLSPEECEAIFTSGYRGHASRGVTGGLGIGLAQSRRVAESAGGSLMAHSKGINTGSTFTVELPRSAEQPISAVARPWALVVDDQPALVDFYRKIATALNIPPVIAASVPDAEVLLKEHGRPSFVLTDIHLGNSNGLDLVRMIRSQFGASVPVLVISGLTGEGIEQQARSAGADDFVAKPVGRRALYARIQSLLSLN